MKDSEIKGMASAMHAFLSTPPSKAPRSKADQRKPRQPPVGLAQGSRGTAAASGRIQIPLAETQPPRYNVCKSEQEAYRRKTVYPRQS